MSVFELVVIDNGIAGVRTLEMLFRWSADLPELVVGEASHPAQRSMKRHHNGANMRVGIKDGRLLDAGPYVGTAGRARRFLPDRAGGMPVAADAARQPRRIAAGAPTSRSA